MHSIKEWLSVHLHVIAWRHSSIVGRSSNVLLSILEIMPFWLISLSSHWRVKLPFLTFWDSPTGWLRAGEGCCSMHIILWQPVLVWLSAVWGMGDLQWVPRLLTSPSRDVVSNIIPPIPNHYSYKWFVKSCQTIQGWSFASPCAYQMQSQIYLGCLFIAK